MPADRPVHHVANDELFVEEQVNLNLFVEDCGDIDTGNARRERSAPLSAYTAGIDDVVNHRDDAWWLTRLLKEVFHLR